MAPGHSLSNFPEKQEEEDGFSSDASCTSTLNINPKEEDEIVPETDSSDGASEPAREYKDKPWMWDFHDADRAWVAGRNHGATHGFGLYMVDVAPSTSHASISMIESFHRWRWSKTKLGKRNIRPTRLVLLEQWNSWIKEVYIEEISDDSGIEFPVARPVLYSSPEWVRVVANDTTVYTALDLIEGRPYRCEPIAVLDPIVEQATKYEADCLTYQLSMTEKVELSEFELLREHLRRQDEHMRRQDMEIQQLKARVRILEYNDFL